MTESQMKSKYNEESAKKVVRVVLHDGLPTFGCHNCKNPLCSSRGKEDGNICGNYKEEV